MPADMAAAYVGEATWKLGRVGEEYPAPSLDVGRVATAADFGFVVI